MKTDRRAEIAERAAILFDQHGFHQTTMEDIAVEVGLKKPTLYHYVHSKDEILYLIHEDFLGLLFDGQREREALNLPCDEKVRQSMRDILQLMVSHRSHVRVFFEHYRELSSRYQDLIKPKRDEYFRLIVGFIRDGVDEGRYGAVDPELAALAMFGMCNWAYTWFNENGPVSADEVADNFWRWLTSGIAAAPSSSASVSTQSS